MAGGQGLLWRLAALAVWAILVAGAAADTCPGPLGGVDACSGRLTAEERAAHAHLRPLIFIKTHKTAGSTLAGIVHRMGDWRNLSFQLPPNNIVLGWPGPYPGKDQPLPNHQFDIITNHMIYDPELCAQYVKPNPFVFTILREPRKQFLSAFAYFQGRQDDVWDHFFASFDILSKLTKRPCGKVCAHFRNSQAHDLGWYRSRDPGHTIAQHDAQASAVADFIDWTVHSLDLVLLTEDFDRGVVLLARKLHVPLKEMLYQSFKNQTLDKKRPSRRPPQPSPTPAHLERVPEFIKVDEQLYARHVEVFSERWAADPGAPLALAEFAALKNLAQPFPRVYRVDSVEYTTHLWARAGCQDQGQGG